MIINLFNKETTDCFFYEMSYVQIDYCMSLLQKLTEKHWKLEYATERHWLTWSVDSRNDLLS